MRKLAKEDLERACIPRRFWEVKLSKIPDTMPYKKKIINYIRKLPELMKEGVGLYLYSEENSTGKTSISCIIGKYALKMGYTVLFVLSDEYIDNIITNEMFDEVQSFKERAYYVDILIIDDAVKEYRGSSGYAENKLEALIRYRCQHKKLTILTSNKLPKQIKNIYSQDLSELMRESMIPVEIQGMNWRKIKEKELRDLI